MTRTLLLVVFLWPALLPAQVTGRLTGSVLDSSGAAVPGATIDLLLPGGKRPVLTAKTNAEGLFHLTGVRPESYDLTVSSQGFVTAVVRGVKVDPARETVAPPVKLEVASVTASIDVRESAPGVQTGNAEISSTITKEQVRLLPVLDRYALDLVQTQAGVVSGRSYTVINGLRSTYSNVTLDGINIQDNLFRETGLDYTPNYLQLDQVSEVTVSTSNANATQGGGAAQVNIVTPSGTNQYHGSLLWYNRNNALAATDWFDNMDGTPKAFLNENIFGGSVGGPIIKDKLLFYANFESVRLKQNASQDRTILTQDARNGIFTYRDSGGAVRQVNVLTAAGVQMDPTVQSLLAQVPGPDKINNFRMGDSRSSFLRNTAGYSFQARDDETRDNITAKLDYILSTKHVFSGSYIWNRRLFDVNDSENDYSVVPKVYDHDHVKLISGTWRWNPRPNITNELRGGANIAPGDYVTNQQFGSSIVDGFIFDNPVNTFQPQGRDTSTYSLSDNATWLHGRHNLQFGFQTQQVRVAPYNNAGIIPTYYIGIGTGNDGLTRSQLSGAGANDVATANALLASLGGYIEEYSQQFNVASRTSGFVDGANNLRHYRYNNYALYLQDSWKIAPRLSLNLGLRWDYYGVVDERDSLLLTPVIENGNPISTLLSNATLDYGGSAAGRPLYNKDLNNFAPNVGLAWDVFGDGKTAIRAGYSIHYVDDNTIATVRNNTEKTNDGLSAYSEDYGLTARIGSGLPKIPVPTFQVPRTFSDNYDLDSMAAFGMPDPNLRTPYVQEWSFGVEQNIKGNILEVRYVGNHATKSLRALDYNQVVIGENGFLDDFLRAQNNASLAGGNPAYNANIPGSQPLPVFSKLYRGGQLNNSTIRNLIAQGQVGELAATYQIDGNNGPVNFFRNPYALGTNMITNYSNSTYNALQVELRRRTRSGLEFQGNYTFSKVLSDAQGDTQTRFDPFLDNNNPAIERARAPYDINHVFKANAAYELPLGEGHRFGYKPLNRLLSGWSLSGVMVWQSGTPFSILSQYGTLNRAARSASNTATTALNGGQLDGVVGFRMTADGPYFVDPSILTDGRGTGGGNSVFFNPAAGDVGSLQRRMFSGPWMFNLDLGVQKMTKITENQSLELRMESTNVLNHPAFFVGDESADPDYFNINSTTFGQIAGTLNGRRVIQLGLYYRF